jgi:hypothetical protein
MKEKVQERINQMRELATKPVKTVKKKTNSNVTATDSLSKAIRNSKEAKVFLTELNAAISISQFEKR